MMSNINFKELDLFDDDEINTVCENADLNMFLAPIKNKRYEKYSKRLGRLDKKSALVQMMLPKMAFNLYKKNEEPFKAAVVLILQEYKEKFLQAISECMKPSVEIDEIVKYMYEQMTDFYFRFQEVSTTEISEELFYIFLKLQGISYSEEDKKSIESSIKQKRDEKFIEEKHKAEIMDALKKLEKEMTEKCEAKQEELKQQIRRYEAKYEECLTEKNAVQKSLDSLKAQIEYDRRKMESEWQEEYEKQLERRKNAYEEEFRIRRIEAEDTHQVLLKSMEIAAA